jgi:beta-galactosidase
MIENSHSLIKGHAMTMLCDARWLVTMLALGCVVLVCDHVRAQQQVDLVRNGSFEQAGPIGGAAGWTRGDPALVKFITENGKRFCRIELPQKKAAIIEQAVNLPTGTQSIDVSVRMRVADLVKGEESWNTGMLQYQFLDSDGKRVGGWPKLMPPGNLADWTRLSEADQAVPADAVKLRVQCGVWGASGTFDFDDVKVVAHTAEGAGPGDKLQFEQPEVQSISPTRRRMSLNGDWQYMPAIGAAAKQPAGPWQVRPVPDAKGNDDRMWYQRQVRIPADWDGRAVVMNIERVSTDATVFVNGEEAGVVNWPGGKVDLTPHIKAGADNRIRLLVVAVDDLKQVTQYMGYLDEPTHEAKLDHRGLIGDVSLLSRPGGGHVAHVHIQPSVREQAVRVDVELAGVDRAGQLNFTAEMLDEDGQVEKTFTTTRQVGAGDQPTELRFDWPNPRLWDIGQPNLYTMRLTVEGDGVHDVYTQRFGFREFWIDGRRFYLNRTEVRLRPTSRSNYASGVPDLQEVLDDGYNFIEMWPWDNTRRGSFDTLRDLGRYADEAGILISANVGYTARLVRNWQDKSLHQQWQRIVEQDVRHWRNHPSVVMYSHTANAVAIRSDSDPWLLGIEDASVVQEYRVRRERVLELIGRIKSLDPKPVFAHHGGDNGDVHTSNMYLNFLPLQERAEWISHWTEHGDMPYLVVEFGLPLYATVMRGRSGYGHQGKSEPLMTEWAAAFLGPEAYAMEPAEYRQQVIVDRYKGTDPQAEYDPHIRWDNKHEIVTGAPAFEALMDLFITRTYRSWRGLGISGGMVPWAGGDFQVLRKVNGPALAWIAGPGGVPNQQVDDQQPLTDRTHHYTPGQTLAKQIMLINDYRQAAAFKLDWSVQINNKRIAGDSATGEMAISQVRKLPIEVTLPRDIATDGKVPGRITMTATIGQMQFEDQFDFTVWPAQSQAMDITVAAFDPLGDTTDWLKRIGVKVQPWTQGQPTGNLAIVGRNALSAGHQIPGDIDRFVREGGRLIVFTQDPQWIEHALHLRVVPQSLRQSFVAMADHPVVAGFDAEDLSYWNGSSTTVEGYPHYPQWEWTPKYGWRWGNRHTVSAAPLEKPHRGSWTPLIQQGFDLAYTPLMQMRYGDGLVIFNTLDVEGRTREDPVARALTGRLVRYAAGADLPDRPTRVAYIGGKAGRAILDQLGLVYQAVDSPDESIDLLIVGSDVNDDPALRQFIEAGGKAVFLRRESSAAPLGVKLTRNEQFLGSHEQPGLPEARGLTASDLRYRAASPAWVLAKGPGLKIDAAGQLGRMQLGSGVAVFAQLGPDALPADQKRYLRFTRWRQTRALSQVLANLGAAFEQDQRFIALLKTPDHYLPLAGPWRFQPVHTLPESPDRQWNSPKPISEQARNLVAADAPANGWRKVIVPGYLEGYGPGLQWIDGEFVYRKAIDWPAYAAGKPAVLSVGRVDETETSFVNGQQVGHSRHWVYPRAHNLPAGLLNAGANTIAVRVWDEGIHGGMSANPQYLYLKVKGEDPGFYHDDYVGDEPSPDGDESQWKRFNEQWKVADDPYRYYRW